MRTQKKRNEYVSYYVGILCAVALTFLVTVVTSNAGEERYTLLSRGVPNEWIRTNKVSTTTNHRLDIPLNLMDNGKAIMEASASRSNPADPMYAKFFETLREIEELSPPHPKAASSVRQWLKDCDVDVSTNAIFNFAAIRLENVTSREVECLLHPARMYTFQDRTEGRLHTALVGDVAVPDYVRPYVSFIPGIVDFPLPKKTSSMKRVLRREDGSNALDKGVVAPKTIQALYNVPSSWYDTPSLANTTLLVAEFLSETAYEPSYVFGDGKKEPGFFKEAGLGTPKTDVKIVGAFKPDGGELEAELDIQYTASTARGVSMIYWTEERWMYEFATSLLAGKDGVDASRVDVVSVSFTWSERKECTQPSGTENPTCTDLKVTSQQYVDRVNVEFAKLAALGVSVFVSSGDDGAPGNLGTCDSTTTLDSSFPASSDFVTTVGATMLKKSSKERTIVAAVDQNDPICKDNNGCATSDVETACSYPAAGITTGGGFSVFTPRPDWQKDAVSSYLASSSSSLPPQHMFNASGRGYPDLSAVGHNYAVYFGELDGDGFWIPTDGTSASTPVIAGIFAMIKSQLGRRLGHVAPSLYKISKETTTPSSSSSPFKDITSGSNICKSTCCGEKTGFRSSSGWDPVTGLGSVDAEALFDALSKL